jgi:hypothetical protein
MLGRSTRPLNKVSVQGETMMRLPNRPKICDAVVVLVCVVLVAVTIAAVGAASRRRAKEYVCQSNLHQWFGILQDH